MENIVYVCPPPPAQRLHDRGGGGGELKHLHMHSCAVGERRLWAEVMVFGFKADSNRKSQTNGMSDCQPSSPNVIYGKHTVPTHASYNKISESCFVYVSIYKCNHPLLLRLALIIVYRNRKKTIKLLMVLA